MTMNRKHIFLLSTGGTIASAPGEDGRNISGALPGEQLASALQLDEHIQLEVRPVCQKPSNAINAGDWHALASICQQLAADGKADGIVITHGTDTLEDTAFYLDCVLDTHRIPVIVTGSQRVPHATGSDALTNLGSAIKAAASSQCQGLGVLVAFNESLYSAHSVRKISSFQLDGFDSPGLGRLGFIDQDQVTVLQKPVRLPRLATCPLLPRVDIASVYAGASATLLQAIVASGAQALVIDGLGRGHVPPDWMPVIRSAIAGGMPMVMCSATLHGSTRAVYQFVGSLHDFQQAGGIATSHLSARKARIRTALLLGNGIRQPDALRQAFCWQTPATR